MEDYRFGVTVASIFRSQGAKDVHPQDFMRQEEDLDEPAVDEFAERLKYILGVKKAESEAQHG